MQPEPAKQALDMIHQAAQQANKDLTDIAIKYAKDEINSLMEQTREELGIIKKERPTLDVKYTDGKRVKLKTKAVPYLERMITNSKLKLNTLLVGPAGCGKTTAARQLSEALELAFGSVCFTAGASESWLFGRQTPNGFIEGKFSEIYKKGGVFLADELDAADANLLLAINTALANNVLYNPISGEEIQKHENFSFVGGANTFGKGADHVYTGRNRLDAATLDRFVVINVDYDTDYEREICQYKPLREALTKTREKLRKQGFEEIVSTRTFDSSYRLLKSGIAVEDLMDSITASWNQEAADILRAQFKGKGVKAFDVPKPKEDPKKTIECKESELVYATDADMRRATELERVWRAANPGAIKKMPNFLSQAIDERMAQVQTEEPKKKDKSQLPKLGKRLKKSPSTKSGCKESEDTKDTSSTKSSSGTEPSKLKSPMQMAIEALEMRKKGAKIEWK